MPKITELPSATSLAGADRLLVIQDGELRLVTAFDVSQFLTLNPQSSADYTVASKAEWDTVFANDAATLSGKIVEVAAAIPEAVAITNRDFHAAGSPVVIRSRDANSSLARLEFNTLVRGVDFSGLKFQMTGWPYDHVACVSFGTGTFGKLRFLNGTSFRHGYGASLTDFDTDADLPEYDRIDNVQTATTTSATYALTWKDSISVNDAWIEFFNRGSETVHVAVGGSGVTASTSNASCAPGARLRINGLDPTTDTHIAIIAASGTSEVNARTEIGLSQYLAAAFQQTGGATLEDIEIRGCLFRDLDNGLKGLRPSVSLIAMDNDFDRIYQDIVSLSPEPGVPCYFLRNLECLPFSRSGIAENLNGDARDPHGDQLQLFENSASGTLGPIYYAGNRIRLTPKRAGATSQGFFASDNDFDPSYSDIYLVSTMQIGGSGRAISIGEAGTPFKVRDTFIYGATVLDGMNPASTSPFVTVDHDGDGSVYVGGSIAPAFTASDAPMLLDGNLAAFDPAIFANIGNLSAATNRAEIEAALTTSGAGAGLGAVATANAVDWTTQDHTAVIRWENLPSGVHWNAFSFQPPNSVITLPLRKVLNRRASQAVSVGAGTEWRSVDTDGTTEVQAWTSSAGTIAPDQFIQIRRTSGAGGETVAASVTINGFTQTVDILAADSPPTWLVQGATAGYFVDTANVPGATTSIEYRAKLYFPTSVPSAVRIAAQASTGCDFFVQIDGSITATAEDGTGSKFATNLEVAPAGTIVADSWLDVRLKADAVAEQFEVTVSNVTTTTPFTASGNGVFQSNREVSLLATSTGVTPLPQGTRIADLSVYFNDTLHKAISNNVTTANADAWKRGGVLTQGSV